MTAFKAYLAAQAAAGTPVTIAYALATPTQFQATGNAPIPALPGVNTIYSDADSVTVTGRADPIHTIQAPTGAHDAYGVGAQVTYNGQRYRCKLANCVWSPDAYPDAWELVE